MAAFDPGLNGELLHILALSLPNLHYSKVFSDESSIYLHDCQISEPAPHAQNLEIAKKLWSLSERLVDQKFDIVSGPNL